MSEQGDLKSQIEEKKRRLRLLKQKEARLGYSADPSLTIEIEDLDKEIKNLWTVLATASSKDEPSSPTSAAPVSTIKNSGTQLSSGAKKKDWTKIGAIATIVAVVIALVALIISSDLRSLIFSPETPAPAAADFTYQVRVQDKDTGDNIASAVVILEVGGKAPLDGITDSNGLARIFVSASHAGQPGRLVVEANGYKKHRQEIDITEGALPKDILLEPES